MRPLCHVFFRHTNLLSSLILSLFLLKTRLLHARLHLLSLTNARRKRVPICSASAGHPDHRCLLPQARDRHDKALLLFSSSSATPSATRRIIPIILCFFSKATRARHATPHADQCCQGWSEPALNGATSDVGTTTVDDGRGRLGCCDPRWRRFERPTSMLEPQAGMLGNGRHRC